MKSVTEGLGLNEFAYHIRYRSRQSAKQWSHTNRQAPAVSASWHTVSKLPGYRRYRFVHTMTGSVSGQANLELSGIESTIPCLLQKPRSATPRIPVMVALGVYSPAMNIVPFFTHPLKGNAGRVWHHYPQHVARGAVLPSRLKRVGHRAGCCPVPLVRVLVVVQAASSVLAESSRGGCP